MVMLKRQNKESNDDWKTNAQTFMLWSCSCQFFEPAQSHNTTFFLIAEGTDNRNFSHNKITFPLFQTSFMKKQHLQSDFCSKQFQKPSCIMPKSFLNKERQSNRIVDVCYDMSCCCHWICIVTLIFNVVVFVGMHCVWSHSRLLRWGEVWRGSFDWWTLRADHVKFSTKSATVTFWCLWFSLWFI